MTKFWSTVAFRLALSYGLLAMGSMSVISAAFYFGTVGVLARSTDGKLLSISNKLAAHFDARGGDQLRQEIEQLLADGIEQDTEVYLLIAPDGRKLVGNIAGWTAAAASPDRLTDLKVLRNGRPSLSRLLPRVLPDGSILVVGRDMQDQREIEQLVWHALLGVERRRCCSQLAALYCFAGSSSIASAQSDAPLAKSRRATSLGESRSPAWRMSSHGSTATSTACLIASSI